MGQIVIVGGRAVRILYSERPHYFGGLTPVAIASREQGVNLPDHLARNALVGQFSAHGSLACATALVAAFVALSIASQTAAAAEATPSETSIEQHIQALVPSLEDYVSANMKSFNVPGLAIGIVAGNKPIYAKGFGVRAKGGAPVDTQTLFQIGSTTKAFLSTTMAIAVDRGKLHWDDRIVDLDPDFQMRDPWVTREFRVFDLMAQRSGLPPYDRNHALMQGGGGAGLGHPP
jgi:CubicO group peptidase (beta-lactamase class C family)